jgi:multiple sugar transport system substrate-binding protein
MYTKKLYPIVVILIMVSMILAGCAPQATPTPQTIVQTVVVEKQGTPEIKYVEVTPTAAPTQALKSDAVVTINWWGSEKGRDTQATRDLHFKLARAFEAAHPNTKVAVSMFPSKGFGTRVMTAIAAGQGPDIWYDYYANDKATQGFYEDLTPYMTRDNLKPEELWFPIAQMRSSYNGHYYAVPRDATGYVFIYNKDLFDAAKVEYPQAGWTVEDFHKKAVAVANPAKKVYGTSAIDSGWFQWHPFSFNLGAEFVSPDGKKVEGFMDTPAAYNAMHYILDLAAKDKVSAPAGMAEQFGLDFLSGQIAMFGVSTWEVPLFLEKAKFKYGVIAPPSFKAGEESISWTDSYMFYMNAKGQYKDRTWEFMKFLSGPDGAKIMADSGVWMPALPKVWEEKGWAKDPILGPIYAELKKPARVLNYERSQFYFDCVSGIFDQVTTAYIDQGKTDVETMVPPLVKDAQACLDKNYADLNTK